MRIVAVLFLLITIALLPGIVSQETSGYFIDVERSGASFTADVWTDNVSEDCSSIEWIELQYTGDIPNITVDVFVHKDFMATFTGISTGDIFLIHKDDAPNGRLNPKVRLEIDGVEVAEIHTSCSLPIDIGDIHGDFVIYDLKKLP